MRENNSAVTHAVLGQEGFATSQANCLRVLWAAPLSVADQPTLYHRHTLSIARYYGEEMTEDTLTDPLNALDLRNRNITSIADGGLGCYTMQTVVLSTSNVNVARLRQAALLALLK
jgi:hypothetical protein